MECVRMMSITEEVDPEGGEAGGMEGTKLKYGRGKAVHQSLYRKGSTRKKTRAG